MALAHSEFEWLNCLIHGPPLMYKGSIVWSLSSNRWVLLRSDAWNVICQFLMMLLHSSFLLKSHDSLQGSSRERLNFFMSLSTIWWWSHLLLLGQSQNSMAFIECLRGIKDAFSCMNSIHNDNDTSGFWYLDSLAYTISDSKVWLWLKWHWWHDELSF